ncbi:MAG: D-alanyl-D-alanine carboxypeptidase, partial [Hyphomicrobiales bacterium]
ALVTKSANDVAVVVAESIGGSQKAFAERMTRTARYIGMTRTRFRNASGLPDGAQVTTARDMATLALRIQRDFPQYYPYFKIRKFVYKGRTYFTHNKLLGRYRGTDGVKTGYTRASGFNLTSSVRRDGRHVIGVVMGAKSGRSRNKYMKSMLTRAFKRVPKRSSPKVANTAGKPPGLKSTAKPSLLTHPPIPAPKPITTQTATPTQTTSPGIVTAAAPPIPAAPPPPKFAAPIKLILLDQTQPAQPAAPQQTAAVRPSTWSIQIGAYASENDAKQRLASMQQMGFKQLSGKKPFTVAFLKKKRTIYRARFGGFDRNGAQKTCRALKQRSISCFALAPAS